MRAAVARAFAGQARSCLALGSPFTAALCRDLPAALDRAPVALRDRVADWPGDPSSAGDSVPLRLCGALHAIVLAGEDGELARAYADRDLPVAGLARALDRHAATILDWLDRPPQTNEVARSAPLILAARFLATLCPLPLRLRELGASAGLNLNFDRYDLGGMLESQIRGAIPEGVPQVADRRGVDLTPLDPRRDARRLQAYCWADQPARLARLHAALAIAADHPAPVDQGDAAAWLAAQLRDPVPGRLTVVFHTVAAQYFPPETRATCSDTLMRAGAAAGPDAPLAHLAMEADGGDGAGLTLTLWDGARRDWDLGRTDFHGRWIDWSPRPRAPGGLPMPPAAS